MVLIRDPVAVKEVYSAEGQYPARSESKNMVWLFNQRNEQTGMHQWDLSKI